MFSSLCLGLLLFFARTHGRTGSGLESTTSMFLGCCGTSAAVSVDSQKFLVADDEDNKLRLYDRDKPGQPVRVWDFARELAVSHRDHEADIEGAARIGNTVFWIGSHGLNHSGEFKQARHVLFATELVFKSKGVDLAFSGKPYRGLIEDLSRDPRFAFASLRRAAGLMPKQEDGLNIEGLSARSGGGLWIGFRNPIPQGLALLVPFTNPGLVLRGAAAEFEAPVRLDLGGKGIRDMVWDGRKYWILGGNRDGHFQTALYSWDGGGEQPRLIDSGSLRGFNPEALVLPGKEHPGWITVLSDDGNRSLKGTPCRDLPVSNRSFRTVDIQIGNP